MSDIPQAPDWWQASDGKWYPPQPGQNAPDPFQQMQQGTTVPPGSVNMGGGMPFKNLGGGGGNNPFRSVFWIIMVVTIVSTVGIALVVFFAVDEAENAIDQFDDAFDDQANIDAAEITSCVRGDFQNWAEATVDVTNDTDSSATFFVDIAFESRNGERQFGTGSAIASSLAPGRTIEVEASSTVEVPARFTCTVTGVRRVG